MMASDSCLVQIYIFYDPFLVNSHMFFTGITLFALFLIKICPSKDQQSFIFPVFFILGEGGGGDLIIKNNKNGFSWKIST